MEFFVNGCLYRSLLEAFKDATNYNVPLYFLSEGERIEINSEMVFGWVGSGICTASEKGKELIAETLLYNGNDFKTLCKCYDLIQDYQAI